METRPLQTVTHNFRLLYIAAILDYAGGWGVGVITGTL